MKPIKLSGSYKASGCDELHAFESTHGKTIGGMNTKVNAKLKELYKQGINPEVVDVVYKEFWNRCYVRRKHPFCELCELIRFFGNVGFESQTHTFLSVKDKSTIVS